MATLVQDFSSGDREQADLLGGKGANLAEMTRLGLPVPPGFTVTTRACRDYLETGDVPPGLWAQVDESLARLERAMGRSLGDPVDPLLLSIRSGARFSMPGMMDTVLDVGLNDATVDALARASGDERFAWDSYRRFLQMYARTVLGIAGERLDRVVEASIASMGSSSPLDLDAAALRQVADDLKEVIRCESGRDIPQDPFEQVRSAIVAVFDSWNTERARVYRRRERIDDRLGTAVNVQAMVFGNLGEGSGTGVAFTRDPASGEPGAYGDYLPDAQGEDVVAGIRNTLPLASLRDLHPGAYAELAGILDRLERHYRDLCDIEFTIERGRLWMLQTRVGKRSAVAAFRIATALADEGIISLDEALLRVDGHQLARLMFPRFADLEARPRLAAGMGASPGAAVGRAVFDSATATRWAAAGEAVILVRRETSPEDLPGMIAAQGILTSHGGRTSHAAVVARGLGTSAVCGAESLEIDLGGRRLLADDGRAVREGDVISIDGTTGVVYAGEVPVVASPITEHLSGNGHGPGTAVADAATIGLIASVDRLLTHADSRRRLGVRANADTPADARRARALGAEGIGLLRTEHMFLGERRIHIERMILAADDAERAEALAALLPPQREDFIGILEAMDGLPVTIRLLDPPLHEFLPDITDLSVRVAVAEATGREAGEERHLLAAVRRLHEANPMMGLRGVRLGVVVPGLVALQARAIAEAVVQRRADGGSPRAQVMVPLTATAREMEAMAREVTRIVDEVAADAGVELDLPLGTMIELPRAALTADEIARTAEFFSFGTNDLTQATWGFSRDDVEAAFFPAYLERGILDVSPFETLDVDGVGRLVDIAVERGRQSRPALECGVCGEHGGDPASIRFFHAAGLDYVSCSSLRVPVARLEAGRAALDSAVGVPDTR